MNIIVLENKQKRIILTLAHNNPKIFCINDGEKTTDNDRKNVKMILENIFPKKSEFEK